MKKAHDLSRILRASSKILSIFFFAGILASFSGKDTNSEADVKSAEQNGDNIPLSDKHDVYNLVGVDQFGRSFSTVSGMKSDRQVGMFFWAWIGQPYATDIYDATKILAMPNGLRLLTSFDYYDEKISPNGQAHFWGEPLWGYYNSDDEWVMRKQLEMITMAGVDFIYFDNTNGYTYYYIIKKVAGIISDMIKCGWNPPRIVCYTHSRSGQAINELYDNIYKANVYPESWYRVDGKPMIIGYSSSADDQLEAMTRGDGTYVAPILSDEVLNFFHFVRPQWPSEDFHQDGFPWVEWQFPQRYHAELGVVNVTVASHPMIPMSFSLTRQGWTNWGRGWNPDLQVNESYNVTKGTFFQREWDQAIRINPPMISVGGWNEWIAYKSPWDGEYMLCDAADMEYSRDIEPMNGGYEDAFFLQLIKNVRKYKGITSQEENKRPPLTIDINGKISQWEGAEFIIGNTDNKFMARDSYGAAQTVHYSQDAPLNKIVEVRVANDETNLYFYIKGQNAWQGDETASNWLNLYIGTGAPEKKGWNGYEYLIGNSISGNRMSIDKLSSEYEITSVGNASINKGSDVMQISIPLSALSVDDSGQIYFKVAMGVQKPSDIMNTYLTGSVLPMGRLSYLYKCSNVNGGVNGVISEKANLHITGSKGKITFKYDDCSNLIIRIYNLSGELKEEINRTSGNSAEADVPTGFYLVKYNIDGKYGVEKIIVR